MFMENLTISVIIPTYNRAHKLVNVLYDLAHQSRRHDEIIISDSSSDDKTLLMLDSTEIKDLSLNIQHVVSFQKGAAFQRNFGAQYASGDILFFFDDDIRIHHEFVKQIVTLFENDMEHKIGLAGGVIVNAPFSPPSRINRWWLQFLHGEHVERFDGRVIGPVIAFYPDERRENPFYVDWKDSSNIAVRREVFSTEKFDSFFWGYSFKEDVDFSLRISKRWKIVCMPQAKIWHEPDISKRNYIEISRQEVINTYYIMIKNLGKDRLRHKVKFLIYYFIYLSLADIKGILLKGFSIKLMSKIWKGRLSGLWRLRRVWLKQISIENVWD